MKHNLRCISGTLNIDEAEIIAPRSDKVKKAGQYHLPKAWLM